MPRLTGISMLLSASSSVRVGKVFHHDLFVLPVLRTRYEGEFTDAAVGLSGKCCIREGSKHGVYWVMVCSESGAG
jgi:hypothetical protein